MAEKHVLPNFFILGAPKCGTTALSEYLRQHPEVLFSRPKEPNFFNDDFSHRDITSLQHYVNCFAHGDGTPKKAVGEGSVFYLYSRTAVPNVLEHCPRARFIVMLRDPVEAAYSFHWQALYSNQECLDSFEMAWNAQARRANGKDLPPHNRVREVLHYGPFFSYGEQLDRLFQKVPRERVLIILYDDFKSDPQAVFAQVLQFLELSPYSLQSFPRVNASKRHRLPLVERMVQMSGAVRRVVGMEKGFGMLTRIQQWNTEFRERPPVSASFRAELRAYYREDVQRTAALIGRDLSGWLHD